MRLPKHHVVCRWWVDGSPQQAFLAETIPWESIYDESVKQTHLARQPQLSLPSRRPSMATADAIPSAEDLSHTEAWSKLQVPMDEEAALDTGVDTTEMDWNEEADTEETDSAIAPPRWLTWMMGNQEPASWWDTASGAGLTAAWERVQHESGRGDIWEIEGLAAMNPEWAPAVRRRAVHVARALLGPKAVLAWVTPDQLGVWYDPSITLDEAVWMTQGEAHNVSWHKMDPTESSAETGMADAGDDDVFVADVDLEEPERVPSSAIDRAQPEIRSTKKSVKIPESELNDYLWEHFTELTNIPQETIRQWQHASGATDSEIAYTMRWLLTRHIGPEKAVTTFHDLLGRKLRDRLILPICDQVDASSKKVRDVLVREDYAKWGQWLKNHPEVTTLEQLHHAVKQAKGRRDVS